MSDGVPAWQIAMLLFSFVLNHCVLMVTSIIHPSAKQLRLILDRWNVTAGVVVWFNRQSIQQILYKSHIQKNIEIIIQFLSAEYKKRKTSTNISRYYYPERTVQLVFFFRIDLLTHVSFHQNMAQIEISRINKPEKKSFIENLSLQFSCTFLLIIVL